eukprot:6201942-Pleurochrysis_carterae.AAC.1
MKFYWHVVYIKETGFVRTTSVWPLQVSLLVCSICFLLRLVMLVLKVCSLEDWRDFFLTVLTRRAAACKTNDYTPCAHSWGLIGAQVHRRGPNHALHDEVVRAQRFSAHRLSSLFKPERARFRMAAHQHVFARGFNASLQPSLPRFSACLLLSSALTKSSRFEAEPGKALARPGAHSMKLLQRVGIYTCCRRRGTGLERLRQISASPSHEASRAWRELQKIMVGGSCLHPARKSLYHTTTAAISIHARTAS